MYEIQPADSANMSHVNLVVPGPLATAIKRERKKKFQLCLCDPNIQPLTYKDTTTCTKGEPEVGDRGSGSYPVIEHCSCLYISGREQISIIASVDN